MLQVNANTAARHQTGTVQHRATVVRSSAEKYQKKCSRTNWFRYSRNAEQYGICVWWWIQWLAQIAAMHLSRSQTENLPKMLSKRYIIIHFYSVNHFRDISIFWLFFFFVCLDNYNLKFSSFFFLFVIYNTYFCIYIQQIGGIIILREHVLFHESSGLLSLHETKNNPNWNDSIWDRYYTS